MFYISAPEAIEEMQQMRDAYPLNNTGTDTKYVPNYTYRVTGLVAFASQGSDSFLSSEPWLAKMDFGISWHSSLQWAAIPFAYTLNNTETDTKYVPNYTYRVTGLVAFASQGSDSFLSSEPWLAKMDFGMLWQLMSFIPTMSGDGVVVDLLACGASGPEFDSRSRRYDFRYWLSPASKSWYGWNIAKVT